MLLHVRFLNWEKYQGESKRFESTHWFRMANRILDHPVADLTVSSAHTFRFFILLLAMVSQNGHQLGQITTTLGILKRKLGGRGCSMLSQLDTLVSLGILEYQELNDTPHGECTVLRNETVRNERYEGGKKFSESSSEPEIGKEKSSTLPPGILADVRNIQRTGKPNEVNDEEKKET